jgi:L-alanine-DL-glutamate epimerase-like enolase superfamily enzyme
MAELDLRSLPIRSDSACSPLTLHLRRERWERKSPAKITGYTWDVNEVLVLSLEKSGAVGCAEALGVYYGGDDPASMERQLETLRARIEAGISRETVQSFLPPGGARNALDCALWDLEAKLSGIPVWERAQLGPPQPLITTFTCHADTPEKMAQQARAHGNVQAIKLKLTGESIDRARVQTVRAELPEVWLGVDANQGFTPASLQALLPTLVDARIELIEQPFKVGQDALLEGIRSPIPIAADESVQSLADLPRLVGRFDVANIKLDKCGGLTEGLAMAAWLRAAGMKVMVGCMGGTSLAMAPAFILGQLCDRVDLDGPTFLKTDRTPEATYVNGRIFCPPELWGGRSKP